MRKKIMLLALILVVVWAAVGCGKKKSQNTGLEPEGVEEIEVEEIEVEEIIVEPITVVTWDNVSIGSW